MKFEVLMATMDRDQAAALSVIQRSRVNADVLLINQCGRDHRYEVKTDKQRIKVLEMAGKGLSKSRNTALANTKADICLIADDDIIYESDVEETIISAFEAHPEYDLIAFYVERSANFCQKEIGREREVNRTRSLELMSVQIAFRVSSIKEKGIQFDEAFGAGSKKYICGEENIFLMDCLRKGLRILYVPKKIATTDDNASSWFHGYNDLYFKSKGAAFQRLYPNFAGFMIVIFGILKRKQYQSEMKTIHAIRCMRKGRKEVKGKKYEDFL